MRGLPVVALALGVSLLPGLARGETIDGGGFVFAIPDGWMNLMTLTDAELARDATLAATVRAMRQQGNLFVVIDVDAPPGSSVVMLGQVRSGPSCRGVSNANQETAKKAGEAEAAILTQGLGGVGMSVLLEAGITRLGSLRAIAMVMDNRIARDTTMGGASVKAQHTRALLYLVAGQSFRMSDGRPHETCALLNYSTDADRFARYRPFFESLAGKTRLAGQ